MARLLNDTKSNVGGPYVFYRVFAYEVEDSRTVDSVDLNVEVVSYLQYSTSSLGRGYPLTGYITLNGNEYSIPIKSSTDSWSGDDNHIQSQICTVRGLESSQTQITNIEFRVSAKNSNESGYLSSKDCDNMPISMGHIPPSLNSYSVIEQNASLINAGISNDVFVDNLSQKQVTLTYELHDDATATKFGVYDGIKPYLYDTNPFTLDLSSITLDKTNAKNILKFAVRDSLGSQTLSPQVSYNNIPYIKISLTNSSTVARRIGQISGRVGLDVSGVLYNGIIGNIDQSSYKPTIKYKYWKVGDTEPSTYSNTIASSNITVNDGTFTVSNLDIGSSTETDVNYFDPNYAWRIKVYVEDNFTNAESNELQIQVGEAVWSEYKDRVDFKKLTLKGTNVPKVVYGQTALVQPSSGGTKDVTIDYSSAGFTETPKIFAIFEGNANDYRYGSITLAVVRSSITTTGATLRFLNNSGYNPSFYINWVAIGV